MQYLRHLRTLATLVAVSLPWAPLSPRSEGDCSTPIKLDMSGPRPALTLRTSTGREFPVIFDTAAMQTTVNPDFADALGLRNEGPPMPPFDKHVIGYSATLRGSSIGPVALADQAVLVMPTLLPDKALVLSPTAFGGKPVTLDLAAGTLTVCAKPPKGADELGYAYSTGSFSLPAVPVEIGGLRFDAHFDTGSSGALALPTKVAMSLPMIGSPRKVGAVRTHWGEQPLYKAKLAGVVKIGPLTLDEPEVAFADIIPNVNVGMALLRRFRITIDPTARRTWVETADSQSVAASNDN